MMPQAIARDDLRQIPVDLLHPSPFNPRQDMPRAELKELAASIASVGILQPILVRLVSPPVPEPRQFEIVCGHRRVAAAKLAGLATVPAVVQEMDDGEARRRQLIENMQRKDLTPLEEAEGFQELIRGGASVEEAATATHKSVGTVYARLQLLNLPAAAVKALKSGLLPVTVATLIGRIPHEELRKQATTRLLENARRDDDPVSYSFARRVIRHDFMTDLASAPFPVKNETLVPEAGSCLDCPERTGNNLDLFGDVAAEKRGKDVCTNPTCFQAKAKAWADIQVELAAANGQKVLSAKDVKKVWPRGGGHTDYSSPYIALDDECYEDSKNRRYKTLLGSDAPETILAIDPSGHPRQLVPRAEAEAILAKKHAWAKPRGRGTSSGPSPAEKKRRAEGEHVARVNSMLMARVVEVAEGQALRTPSVEVWATIAGLAIRRAWDDTLKDVCRRRGWLEEKPAKGKGRPPRLKSHQDILLGKLGELSGAQARGLAIEVLYAPYVGLARPNSGYSRTSTSGPALAALGIDLKDVQEIVRREEAQEAKAKSAPKRTKKAAAEGAR